jgi:hypothetical protein
MDRRLENKVAIIQGHRESKKCSNGKWRGSVERKKDRSVGQDYGESPFCLILDIENRLRKMSRVDSGAFLEMLRAICKVRNPKQANVQRRSRYVE